LGNRLGDTGLQIEIVELVLDRQIGGQNLLACAPQPVNLVSNISDRIGES
jgi:hypothetical protein